MQRLVELILVALLYSGTGTVQAQSSTPTVTTFVPGGVILCTGAPGVRYCRRYGRK